MRLTRSERGDRGGARDRKSTRLNSSHVKISYAVFYLKKKNYFGQAAYCSDNGAATETTGCYSSSLLIGMLVDIGGSQPGTMVYFFFNATQTTEIYTLSLHDALPISRRPASRRWAGSTTTTLWSSSTRATTTRSEEHTSELQSRENLVCRLLLEKKKKKKKQQQTAKKKKKTI